MSSLTFEILDELITQIERIGLPLQDIMVQALERYVQAKDSAFLITQRKRHVVLGHLIAVIFIVNWQLFVIIRTT